MTFDPKPIDTSGAQLSASEQRLVEELARNAHHVWAKARMGEGWRYAPVRDDKQRVTNLLVPYEELSEAEKDVNRGLVRQTLEASGALGWTFSPTAPIPLSSEEAERLAAFDAHLKREACAEGREHDFDLVDDCELETGAIPADSTLGYALRTQAEVLRPVWKALDTRGIDLCRKHYLAARVAIVTGTAALVFAIVQLVVGGVLAEWMEKVALLAAVVTVGVGLGWKLHHGWLATRQAAERIRLHKFTSLVDPLLWSDREAWRAKLEHKVTEIAAQNARDAEGWARRVAHGAPPAPAGDTRSVMSTYELNLLARYYQSKRHGHQRAYFHDRHTKLSSASWPIKVHLPMWFFFGSVVCVAAHLAMHLWVPHDMLRGGFLYGLERGLLAAGAILPIVGFGVRAMMAAFETPRRAMLFEAKRNAVDAAMLALQRTELNVPRLFDAITESEALFETEHREWCRLQFAAEWFL